MAGGSQQPTRILFHAKRTPDLFRQVVAQFLPGRRTGQNPDQVGLAGLVDPLGAGRCLARQFAHIADCRIDAGIRLVGVELGDVRFGVAVILIPFYAGCHRQQLLDGDVIVGGPPEVGNVIRYFVVDTPDIAILDGSAHQCRGDRFGNREAGPALAGTEVNSVFFQADVAFVNDHQCGSALILHIGIDIRTDRKRRSHRQGIDGLAAGNDPGLDQERQSVHCAKSGIALRKGPEQDIFVGRYMQNQPAHIRVSRRPEYAAGGDCRQQYSNDPFSHGYPLALFSISDFFCHNQ